MKKKRKREPTAELIRQALEYNTTAAANLLTPSRCGVNLLRQARALEAVEKAIGVLCHIRNRLGDQKAEKHG